MNIDMKLQKSKNNMEVKTCPWAGVGGDVYMFLYYHN